ncbi:MAG TPA: HNH endonuclease family protein [Candidatus Saccharimonadales bacterium]
MGRKYRIRLISTLFVLLFVAAVPLSQSVMWPAQVGESHQSSEKTSEALRKLGQLAVKGRAPKTGYARAEFGDGWAFVGSCDTRNIILARDLKNEKVSSSCKVLSGTLDDPYTGKVIEFQRGADTSDDVQIDHVVALSNAWQTGAQQLSFSQRKALANDPLELLAVDGKENQNKSDGDAATWLPSNKTFRCQYVSRQIDVKLKYQLWMTPAEKQAIERVLSAC